MTGALVLTVSYVTLQLERTGFVLLAVARHDRALHHTRLRIFVWIPVAGNLWSIGALRPLEWRLPLWGIALTTEYLSASLSVRAPGLGKSTADDWDISGAHIAERSAL